MQCNQTFHPDAGDSAKPLTNRGRSLFLYYSLEVLYASQPRSSVKHVASVISVQELWTFSSQCPLLAFVPSICSSYSPVNSLTIPRFAWDTRFPKSITNSLVSFDFSFIRVDAFLDRDTGDLEFLINLICTVNRIMILEILRTRSTRWMKIFSGKFNRN